MDISRPANKHRQTILGLVHGTAPQALQNAAGSGGGDFCVEAGAWQLGKF